MQVKAWKAHDDIVMCIHFVDGIILSGAKDKLIKMWKLDEARNPLLMATYKGHTDSIVGVILAPKDKSLVASVSSDMSLKLWEGV
jgi:WD40 repeat protein